MSLRFQPRSLLTVAFILLFSYIVVESSEMPIQAKMYPYTIGIIALLLLAYQLVREILPAAKTETDKTGVDIDFTVVLGGPIVGMGVATNAFAKYTF